MVTSTDGDGIYTRAGDAMVWNMNIGMDRRMEKIRIDANMDKEGLGKGREGDFLVMERRLAQAYDACSMDH